MSLCFAESLKKYQENNDQTDTPEPEVPGDGDAETETPIPPEQNDDPLGVIDPDVVWEPISDKDYKFYDDYSSDAASPVGYDKVVTLRPDQVNIAQESNSQYIPFQMPRFYDGFDIANTKLQFYYVNEVGEYGIDYAVNVFKCEDKIRFAWLVSGSVTKIGGGIQFEIQAIGENSNNDTYIWKTYPNKEINISEALSGNTFIEPDEA